MNMGTDNRQMAALRPRSNLLRSPKYMTNQEFVPRKSQTELSTVVFAYASIPIYCQRRDLDERKTTTEQKGRISRFSRSA